MTETILWMNNLYSFFEDRSALLIPSESEVTMGTNTDERCFVDIVIKTASSSEAERFAKELKTAFAVTRFEDGISAFFGCDMRYISDAHAIQHATEVIVTGRVMSGYTDDEVLEMFNWLRTKVTIKELSIRYEAIGACSYGEYVFDGKKIWNHSIKETDFPKDDNYEDAKMFYNDVVETFQKKSIKREIKTY